MPTELVPTELQKQPEEASTVDVAERAGQECSKLCTQGTDPAQISDCIGYCERLLYNTVELQKQFPNGQTRYVYYPPTMTPNTLLNEAAVNHSNPIDMPSSIPNQIEMNITPTVENNKVLSHEPSNMLMLLTVVIAVLFLFFTYVKQRGKSGGHSYLPRPN